MIYEQYESYIVRASTSGSDCIVHAPRDSSERPLCHHEKARGHVRHTRYLRKDAGVIPNGYYPECKHCRAIIEGEDE